MPNHKRPARIEVKDNLIIVYANNTGNAHIFDYSEDMLSNLQNTGWNEDNSGRLHGKPTGIKSVIKAYWLVLPKKKGHDVDHINRNCRDNRFINLRHLNHSENGHNSKLHKNNTSGVSGVCWYKAYEKWQVRIRKNRKVINIGYFEKYQDAVEARKNAEEKYFPGIMYREECYL